MSYALVEDVAASWETYARIASCLDGSLPDGLILHAAGRTDEGFRIIEVWESEEAWRRFAELADRRDGRPVGAPRQVRELRPARVVLGRGVIPATEVRR
jgi:hypothetical protein